MLGLRKTKGLALNSEPRASASGWAFILWSLCALLLAGCTTPSNYSPTAAGGGPPIDLLRSGDRIAVIFSGFVGAPPPHEERIKEDGTITLPLIGSVVAGGKTVGQLQKDITDLYVPKFYRQLTVTVRTEDRFFFVGGEVKLENRYVYAGEMTVLKAIAAAGGFTDYANKRRIELRRANGEMFIVDERKARRKSDYDLAVYPGDHVVVPRRLY